MADNSKLLMIIAIVLVGAYVFYLFRNSCSVCSNESFWGGYFPVPYMGQATPHFGRSGLDAATDVAPRMFVDLDACNINPYCRKDNNCKGYRCCCSEN